jgi:hypothetical protein
MKEYTWDVSISLCKQDISFASKLVKALNPGLKVFFYEHQQEELITKCGPEAFSKIFKEQSRVIVILSRKEWSESYYTEIERNAIIDRTAIKNEGYQFLMVIPMVSQEIPSWYPSTRIYVDPGKFTIEAIARFIEFKIAEEGGKIKSLTVEDRYQNLLDRVAEKKTIIQIQQTDEAIETATDQIQKLKENFNQKVIFLKRSIIDTVRELSFIYCTNKAHFGYGKYLLECEIIIPDKMYNQIVTTQDFCISFKLSELFANLKAPKLLEEEIRYFYYTSNLYGWALRHLYEQATEKECLVLFNNRNNSQFYDLINPVSSDSITDIWFQKLLFKATEGIVRYI